MTRIRTSLIDTAYVLGCWLFVYWLPVVLMLKDGAATEVWPTVLASLTVTIVSAGRRPSLLVAVLCFAFYAVYALVGFRSGSDWFYHDNPGELSPTVIMIVLIRSAVFAFPVLLGVFLGSAWGALLARWRVSRSGVAKSGRT